MSKLEDKLTASINPAKGKATAVTRTAKAGNPSLAMTPAAPAAPRSADAKQPARALHPLRVWPD